MEWLEEHDNLRRKGSVNAPDSSNPKADSISKNMNNYKDNLNNNNVELTPNSNRKNSDFLINELANAMNSKNKEKGGSTFLIGICGGQSSGKSLISLYLKKHVKDAIILTEKDFFIGNKDRRKSLDDKGKTIESSFNDDYPIVRKNRLIEINNIKNFDLQALKIALTSIKNKEITNVQSWDKEKQVV